MTNEARILKGRRMNRRTLFVIRISSFHRNSSFACRAVAQRRRVLRDSSSRPHWHTGGALEFAPADQRALKRAKDRLPYAVAEHRPVNQTHRKNAPGAQDRFSLENAGQ